MSRQGASPGAPPIDGVFRALSDPTRRQVLERLSSSPASVTELSRPFEMALPSFVEHMKVLEASGLVSSRKIGRVRTYALTPGHLRLAEDWLSEQRAIWERRLDQLDRYVIELKEERSK